MRQIVIRARRETEEKTGESLSLEELLDLYNNLIHDLEISQGSMKDKAKPKKLSMVAKNQQMSTGRSFTTW